MAKLIHYMDITRLIHHGMLYGYYMSYCVILYDNYMVHYVYMIITSVNYIYMSVIWFIIRYKSHLHDSLHGLHGMVIAHSKCLYFHSKVQALPNPIIYNLATSPISNKPAMRLKRRSSNIGRLFSGSQLCSALLLL